jgi:predicted O-methyltransferase YrrM
MNEELKRYIDEHIAEETSVLRELNRQTHLKAIHPRMLSGHLQGTILAMISRMVRPKNILEIGTYTGYSAICLLDGIKEGGKLHTIEIMDEITAFALKFWKKAGVADKIIQHVGDARDIVPTLNTVFDLVFIDAEKEHYIEYYNLVWEKISTGGFIIADNVLWGGKVVDNNARDNSTIGVKAFNDHVKRDDRAYQTILPVRDGLMLIQKK